jgi:hypothetical protein
MRASSHELLQGTLQAQIKGLMNVPTVFQVQYNAYMHTALYTRLVF